ncbi:hypothetical protein WJX81_005265 [Elliptochloris bilobata]|uniref:Uncharacterized protein n=1 Tax=Elliptochloris bilobata TaxID=381761 RepID=A0AAW1S452_9CHLO
MYVRCYTLHHRCPLPACSVSAASIRQQHTDGPVHDPRCCGLSMDVKRPLLNGTTGSAAPPSPFTGHFPQDSPFGQPVAQQQLEDAPFSSTPRESERDAEGCSASKDKPVLTVRALVGGLFVGSLLCCSNTFFGLQTGWVTMGSLQSAILGFGAFQVLERYGFRKLSVGENVILQTTSVATATMPLAAGLVGIIPALGMMTPDENPPNGAVVLGVGQLLLWSFSLAFLGLFIAVPLRTQTILRENLRFPSGTATAKVIRTLHGLPEDDPYLGRAIASSPQHAHRVTSELAADGAAGVRLHARAVSDLSQLRASRISHICTEEPIAENEELAPAESARLLTRRSNMPSLDLDSVVSLARADSALSTGTCLAKSVCLKLQRGSESLRPAGLPTLMSAPPGGAQSAPAAAMPKGEEVLDEEKTGQWEHAWAALMWTFGGGCIFSIVAAQVPWLASLPVLTWLGWPTATAWGWKVNTSLGYVGQGMIMGPKTALSMLAGALLGYAALGPYARGQGWAPGPISDWQNGAAGWILWISLAIMLGDSLTSLALLVGTSVAGAISRRGASGGGSLEYCPPDERIPPTWWLGGLGACAVFCTAVLSPLMSLPAYEPAAAVVLALLVAVLAVRALGQTDLNPVSGVGKLSQVVFAAIAPGKVLANLVAGAVAEAGAQQAGDMMQDFKTAHLLGICPRAQFFAMALGSAASVFVSVGAYSLYTSAWRVPSATFPAPTAQIWLDMAQLVNGGDLPPHVLPYCVVGGAAASLVAIAAFLLQRASQQLSEMPAADLPASAERWRARRAAVVAAAEWAIPSGIGVAVGMYVAAEWTLPRVIGCLAEQAWARAHPASHRQLMVVVASGLVLGEGTASIFSALLRALDVLTAHKAVSGEVAGADERLHALVLAPDACAAIVNAVSDTLEHTCTLKAFLQAVLSVLHGSGSGTPALASVLRTFAGAAPATGAAVLDLLPALLAKAAAAAAGPSGEVEGEDTQCTSTASVPINASTVVTFICSRGWSSKAAASIVSALRALTLCKADRQAIAHAALLACKAADAEDVPAIAHQLLVVPSPEPAVAAAALLGLVGVFDGLAAEEAPADEQRRVQEAAGAVLQDLEMVAKHAPRVVKVWLAKLRPEQPSPFLVAVALTLAGVSGFQAASFAMLKGAIGQALQFDERRASCAWLAGLPCRPLPEAGAYERALVGAARACEAGWGVSKPLVQLALELMAGAGRHAAAFAASFHGTAAAVQAPVQAALMGARVLAELFDSHPPVRTDVLAACQAQLLGASEDAALPFLHLLGLLVRQRPHVFAPHARSLEGMLEAFPLLDAGVAGGLLAALWPACAAREDVKDALVLAMRRSMFGRDLGARLLAARGFLFLITRELADAAAAAPPADPCSQPSCTQVQMSLSQRPSLTAGGEGVTLLHELLGFLRRSLSQQAAVRRAVYQGLPALLAEDPVAQGPVLEMLLLPHFRQLLEPDPTLHPPIRLEKCTAIAQGEEVRVLEPLPELVSCVRAIVLLAQSRAGAAAEPGSPACAGGAAADEECTQELQRAYRSMADRVCQSSLEHWGLDSIDELSAASAQGRLAQTSAGMLLGCLEQLPALFGLHDRLWELVRRSRTHKAKTLPGLTQATNSGRKRASNENARPGGAKRQKTENGAAASVPAEAGDARMPCLTAPCLARLLALIVDDHLPGCQQDAGTSPAQGGSFQRLSRDARFQGFVLRTTLRLLQAAAAGELSAPASGASGIGRASQHAAAADCAAQLGGPLLRTAHALVLTRAPATPPAASAAGADGKKGGRKGAKGGLHAVAVAAVAALLALCASREALVSALGGAAAHGRAAFRAGQEDNLVEAALATPLQLLHQMLLRLLAGGCQREAEAIAGGMAAAARLLPRGLQQRMSTWAPVACQEAPQVVDARTARALVGLHLSCAGGDTEAAMLVASAVVEACANREYADVEPSQSMPIITLARVPAAIEALVEALEGDLVLQEWLLAALQGSAGSGWLVAEDRDTLAAAAFERMHSVLAPVVICCRCSVPAPGAPALLRLLQLAYRLLAAAVRLVLAPKGSAQVPPSNLFQRLIIFVLREMTPNVYQLVLEVVTRGQGGDTEAAPAKGAGKSARVGRLNSTLVFAIETFEGLLIQLDKSAGTELMRNAKTSKNRDFRLILPAAPADAAVDDGAAARDGPAEGPGPAGLRRVSGFSQGCSEPISCSFKL